MSYIKLSPSLYYGIHPSIVYPDIHIDNIINLTESHEFPDWMCPENIHCKYFPIKDQHSVSIEILEKIVDYILELNGQADIYT